jgi:hypothetical protein
LSNVMIAHCPDSSLVRTVFLACFSFD